MRYAFSALASIAGAAKDLPTPVQQQHRCPAAADELSTCIDRLRRAGRAPADAGRKLRQQALPIATHLAGAVVDWRSSDQEQRSKDRLQLARVAAKRSCAYLCCANLGGEGGPAAGEGVGSSRCRWAE